MRRRHIFARQLLKARLNAGMTQVELGLATGICRTVINRYEAATRTPEIENLVSLADVLEVSTDMLLGRRARK